MPVYKFTPAWSRVCPRGRSVRLQTAERVRTFMGYPPLGPDFLREVEAFLEVTGTKLSMLGEEAVDLHVRGERSAKEEDAVGEPFSRVCAKGAGPGIVKRLKETPGK